jgi:hypothetical protein
MECHDLLHRTSLFLIYSSGKPLLLSSDRWTVLAFWTWKALLVRREKQEEYVTVMNIVRLDKSDQPSYRMK